jgi:hypothetical protein
MIAEGALRPQTPIEACKSNPRPQAEDRDQAFSMP